MDGEVLSAEEAAAVVVSFNMVPVEGDRDGDEGRGMWEGLGGV